MFRVFFLCLAFIACLPLGTARAVDVTVYTEFYGAANRRAETGDIVGSLADTVRQILGEANLSHEIKLVPWNRAFQLATQFDNTLIYAVLREPSREQQFHWLVPVLETDLYLYGRASETRAIDRAMIKSGQIKGVCMLGQVTCSMLAGLGIPANMMVEVKDDHTKTTKVVAASRADVLIAQSPSGYPFLDHADGRKRQFKALFKLAEKQRFYLAAGKQVKSSVVQAVREAYLRLYKAGKLPR